MGPEGTRSSTDGPGCAAGTVASKVVMCCLLVWIRWKIVPTAYRNGMQLVARNYGGARVWHGPLVDFSSEKPPCLARGGRSRQYEVLVTLSERRLLDLSGSRVRNLVGEDDVVGHPPTGGLAPHEAQD